MTTATAETGAPGRLRVEHGPRPLGLGFARPRLSWWLPAGVRAQHAHRVEATIDGRVVTSAELDGEEPFLRPWPFPALPSRAQVAWRVQVRTEAGWSGWSLLHQFETGLLERADWQGSFVGAPDDGEPLARRGERGALYLQRRFRVEDEPTRARIYATAHGLYELHLDGVRVGDLELTPGFTSYRSHLEVQTYDVTDLLRPGDHVLTATVTDGWWRGSVGFSRNDRCYGDALALLAQVELVGATGERQVLATDESWQVSPQGPIVAADLIEGQRVDQQLPFPPAGGWQPATVLAGGDDRLTVAPALRD
jgi:alpha-L-rhamnosidase